MAKKISISLSQKSIQNAISEVRKYQRELIDKNELFVRRLAELGIPVIDQNIAVAQGDSDKNHNTYIKINSFGSYSEAKLVVEGSELLYIEFGSGIHYNGSAGTSPHPKGEEFGYTIGSYGKGQGSKDFWFYYADTGEAVMSHGTQSTMPVYKASMEIIQNIRRIAREVFGS
ncbi:Uncharacterised protein [uncultured Clostridium sp.]